MSREPGMIQNDASAPEGRSCAPRERWYTFIDRSGAQDLTMCEIFGKLSEGFIYVMSERLAKRYLNDEPYMSVVRELRLNENANRDMLGYFIGVVADKDVATVRVFDLFEDSAQNLGFTDDLWRKDSLLDIILTGREDLFEELQAKTPIDFGAMDYLELCDLTCVATTRNCMWFLELIAQKLDELPYTAGLNRSSISGPISETRLCLLDYWATLNRTGKLVCIDRYSFIEERLRICTVGALKKAIQYIEEFELGQAEVDYVLGHVMLGHMVRQQNFNDQIGDIYSLTKFSPPEQAKILGLSRYKLPDLFTCKLMLESTDAICVALKNVDTNHVDASELRAVMKTQLEAFFMAERERIGADALSEQVWQLLNRILSSQPAPENVVALFISAQDYHEALVILAEVVPLDGPVATNITEFLNSESGRAWFDQSDHIWQFDFILSLFRRLGRTLSSNMFNISKFRVRDILEWWRCAATDFPGVVQFDPAGDVLRRCVLHTYNTAHWWCANISCGNFTTEQLRAIKVCGVSLGYVMDHNRGTDLLRLFTVCNREQTIEQSVLFNLFRQLDIAVTLDEDLCDLMVIMGAQILLRNCVHELSDRPAQVTSRVHTELSASLTGDSQSIEHRVSHQIAILSRGHEIELVQNAPTSGKTGLELYWEARNQFQNEVPAILPPTALPQFEEYSVFDYEYDDISLVPVYRVYDYDEEEDEDEEDNDTDIARVTELSTHFSPAIIRTTAKAQQIIAGFSRPRVYSPTEICVICLETLGADPAALVQTPCGHIYHNTVGCNLVAHFTTQSTCPLCRATISY